MPASAQVTPLDIFGGLLGAAQAQAAREAWARLSNTDRFCLDRALARRNADIAGMIQRGIGPDDGRLGSFFSECRRFTEPNLRRGFSCTAPDENGWSVATTCNQSFAYRDGDNQVRPVEPREAIELHFSGTRIIVADVETGEGRELRQARAEAQGRAEKLQVLKTTLANYQRDASPVVRSEAARIQARIEQQLAARTGPSAPDTDTISREVGGLGPLSQAEAARLTALDRMGSLRAQAEARTKAETAEGLKKRLADLRKEAAAVSEPPRTVSPTKPTTASRDLGPSFACEKANTPLPILICEDAGLRRIDLEMARPFYALRHLKPDSAAELKAESNDLVERTLKACRIPEAGKVTSALRTRAVPCIAATYQRQKEVWATRVGRDGPPSARQEMGRPIEEHVRLQEALRNAGYLAADAAADGVYGGVTRRAITTFADAQGLAGDGFLGASLADRLGRGPSSGPTLVVMTDPSLPVRIDAVARRYETYLMDLGVEERERSTRLQAQRRLDEQRKRVEGLLAGPVPEDLRPELAVILRQSEGGPQDLPRLAETIEQRFAQIEPRVREAEAVQRAVTDKNRFLVEGDAGDILLLYNSSPRAGAVVRGLDGNLVFDPERTVACTLPDAPADRIALEQLVAKVRSLGAPVRDTLPRCTSAQQQSADLLALERGALRAQSSLFGTVASAVDTGVYSLAATVSKSDIEAARQQEGIRAAEAESEVTRGTSDGLAVLAFGTGSRTVCRVATGDKVLHDRLLEPHEALLKAELQGATTMVAASADGAFLSIKRGQCGAVYGSAKDLAVLIKGLTRDGVSFRYLPIWIAPEAAAKAQAALAEQDVAKRREREAEDRRRERDQAENRRMSLVERLKRDAAEAEATLKGGIPQDLQTFLSGFVADVSGIAPDTSDERLKELADAYAGKRTRIDAAARLTRAVTAKSRFLIEGGRGDLIVLYNDSGKAPSVVRNLRGELVFEDGRGAACLYHAPLSDVFLNRQIRDRSAALGAKLDLPLSACGANDLAKQDLIFAERERLLREPVDRMITLVEAVNGNLFTKLAIVDAAALASVRQAEAAKANEVEAMVRDRKGDGFGVVVLPNSSSVLCRVAPDKAEAHAALLVRLTDRIGDELLSQPVVMPTSADGAFIALKRGECGAVYAASGDLATITEAMTRDGLNYRYLPLWIEPAEVASVQAEIDQSKTRSAEEQFERQRELEDRRRLDREKEKDESARRETQERALRAQWGERARFFEQALGEEAQGFATGDRPIGFTGRYPKLARHYLAQRDDRWEFMSIETRILDYGTALYKDRPLETALATTRIKMRNRVKGEYQDVCYVTGYVNDAEFGVMRDPFGETCDEVGPKLARYKQGERFSSRWIVQ
ncbi:peptidoglycan-binding domain-containing protein [uncultured Methylobacterium sp.]|uniref:peptidoglycan-binding domain-containing protein n=1 Tax=uncultured Methylobacterium sp. TaxID=157278 RepID=UPI0025962D65|nr:peptidoglycan-binding domain-containing protein [uncultured Methylobacterium sp.]